MPYVYSTATNSTDYALYSENVPLNGLPKTLRKIRINGGANLVTEQNGNILTPVGIATSITDEDLEILENNPHFLRHVAAGFLRVDKPKLKPEKAVNGMKKKDKSAPPVPSDFLVPSYTSK